MLKWLQQWLDKGEPPIVTKPLVTSKEEKALPQKHVFCFDAALPMHTSLGRVEYEPEQVAAIQSFLRSAHGQVFLADLQDKVSQELCWAMTRTSNWENACGIARGWGSCVDYVRQFAQHQISTGTEDQERPSLREQLSS